MMACVGVLAYIGHEINQTLIPFVPNRGDQRQLAVRDREPPPRR